MSIKVRKKPRKDPHTKSSILKKARRYLKKWHPDYKAVRAVYDNEFSVWFVDIRFNKSNEVGLIEYGYSGTFIRIETGRRTEI